jgi:hypothetical protein
MYRLVGAAALLVISSMAALGCGSGLSAEDAAIRCDQERVAKGQLFGKTTYDECLSCFEECGDSCSSIATSPPTYACTDSDSSTTSSTSTGQ